MHGGDATMRDPHLRPQRIFHLCRQLAQSRGQDRAIDARFAVAQLVKQRGERLAAHLGHEPLAFGL
eukprot:5323020-Pleurochrysis_carterae.AAC.1